MAETDTDTVLREMAEVTAFVKERVASKEELARVVGIVENVQKDLKEARLRESSRISAGGKLMVRDGRLAGFQPLDLSILKAVWGRRLQGEGEPNWQGNALWQEIGQAEKSLRASIDYDTVYDWSERAEKAAIAVGGMRAGRAFSNTIGNYRADILEGVIRARAMDSTTTAAGDELVPRFEAAQLWMDVNLATNVLPLLDQVPMPTTPYDIPLQFGDTNWYPTVENTQTLVNDLTTAKSTLTAYGVKTGVPFSDELTEDSIVPFIPNLRAGLVRNASEVIDDLLMNADTTATNNINADGTTIYTSTAGKAHWLYGGLGIIHQALMDNSSQAIDVNADVSVAGCFNAPLRKLGKYASASQRGDVVFITDPYTAIAALAMEEVETVDKIGVRATISSGEIASVYGYPLIICGQMGKADTDGKVTSAGNSEENGRVVAVNLNQWKVGFRRGITMEPDREPGKGQTTLYVSLRMALTPRGTASSATHTAIAYNITNVG